MTEANGLGIDRDGRLYWNGKPVEIIGQRLDLTWTQTLIAIVVAIFTGITALGTLVQGTVALHDWACRNNRQSVFACPTPTSTVRGRHTLWQPATMMRRSILAVRETPQRTS